MPWEDALRDCALCPRACHVNRFQATGFCRMGTEPVIARAALHYWEEPCLSGTHGSGTIFFSGCSLRCLYCQNAAISHGGQGEAVSINRLAEIFAELENQGAHNINLVTPTHFVPQIIAALDTYRPATPIVYNCSGYESLDTLRRLEGYIDIYLPDAKYIDSAIAARYSAAPDYVSINQAALAEMCRQTGPAVYDDHGLLRRGTLVRHLVLPGLAAQSMRLLNWISENLPPGTPVSLMGQYTPCGAAREDKWLGRPLTPKEYRLVCAHAAAIGLGEGYTQALTAAEQTYIPPFDGAGVHKK